MAYRDYICCRDCKSKFIYDAYGNIRNSLEAIYGNEDAPNWTVELVCPDCLARLDRAALAQPEQDDADAIIIQYHEATIKRLEKRIEELQAALAQPEPAGAEDMKVYSAIAEGYGRLEKRLGCVQHDCDVCRDIALAQPERKPQPEQEPVITASMVVELRAKTDAPMMDCREALIRANGDIDSACDILRFGLNKPPPPRKPLPEQVLEYIAPVGTTWRDMVKFARRVEQEHGIGGGA